MNPSHPNDPYANPPQPPAQYAPPPQPYGAQMPAPMPYGGGAPAQLDPRARTAGILLLVCALLLLIGLISKSWFTSRHGSIGILGIEECRGDRCQSVSWFDMKRAPGELQAFAIASLLGGLAAIGFLVHSGVVLLMGRPRKIIMKGLNIAVGVAAFAIVSFFIRLGFGEFSKGLSMSWAGITAILAVIGTGIVLQVLVRPLLKGDATPAGFSR